MRRGDNTKGYAAGTKAGYLLHQFISGVFENFTDVIIDAAGNVWSANGWNDVPIEGAPVPLQCRSD